jgi:hypothetical protein
VLVSIIPNRLLKVLVEAMDFMRCERYVTEFHQNRSHCIEQDVFRVVCELRSGIPIALFSDVGYYKVSGIGKICHVSPPQ